jgi:hypothetical protein
MRGVTVNQRCAEARAGAKTKDSNSDRSIDDKLEDGGPVVWQPGPPSRPRSIDDKPEHFTNDYFVDSMHLLHGGVYLTHTDGVTPIGHIAETTLEQRIAAANDRAARAVANSEPGFDPSVHNK